MTDLSVILSVCRGERCLSSCLERLVALEPRQVVVLGPSDGSAAGEILSACARRHGWVLGDGECEVLKPTPQVGVAASAVPPRGVEFSGQGGRPQIAAPMSVLFARRTTFRFVGCGGDGCSPADLNRVLKSPSVSANWMLWLKADECLAKPVIDRLRTLLALPERPSFGLVFKPTCRNPADVILSEADGYAFFVRRFLFGGRFRFGVRSFRTVRIFRRDSASFVACANDVCVSVSGSVADFPATRGDSLVRIPQSL